MGHLLEELRRESRETFTHEEMYEGTLVLENELCVYWAWPSDVLPGGGLITTRARRETVFDLTQEEWSATQDLLLKAKAHLERTMQPDGYSVGWNCGLAGGQFVRQVHLHLIPRFEDEPRAGQGIRYHIKQPDNRRPGPSRAFKVFGECDQEEA